jgi:environmental stress-induced protein Ves
MTTEPRNGPLVLIDDDRGPANRRHRHRLIGDRTARIPGEVGPGTLRRVRIQRFEEHRGVPWKNGRGITREVALGPLDPAGDWAWRVSIADVDADGPFSVFPGIDRTLVVADGSGMVLITDGVEREAHRGRPVHFAGDAGTMGTLIAGPVRDLNLMVRRTAARAWLDVLTDATTATAAAVVVALSEAMLGGVRLGHLDAVIDVPAGSVVEGSVVVVTVEELSVGPGDRSAP